MLYTRSGLLFVALAVTLLAYFGDVQHGAPASHIKPYQYTVPETSNDGWETAHVRDEHIDAEMINALFDRVINETYKNMHSVLLVRNGTLVVEEYFQTWHGDAHSRAFMRALDRVTVHGQQSVTKSVTSLLIGIAIDQQLMQSVNDKIAPFFPEYADLFAAHDKDTLCLKHFLSMTALSWDEWTYPYPDARHDHVPPGLEYTPPAEGQVANYLFALLGLSTEGLRRRLPVPDRALVFYTGLQAQQPRSMASLEALLADY